MATEINTDWAGIKTRDPNAWVTAVRKVRNAPVIRIYSGSIRNASVSGVFELESFSNDPTFPHGEKKKVNVMCLWYGRKPPSSWMSITLAGKFKVLENYSGPVVADIGDVAGF